MYKVNVSAPDLVCVCVDRINDGCPAGRLYDKYVPGGTEFVDAYDLLLQIEATIQACNYPQSTTRYRTFGSEPAEITEKKKVKQLVDGNELSEKKGDIATFVIHVRYRQHSTWQGDIFWGEKQEKVFFRSVLEMLKLIDNALDATDEKEPRE